MYCESVSWFQYDTTWFKIYIGVLCYMLFQNTVIICFNDSYWFMLQNIVTFMTSRVIESKFKLCAWDTLLLNYAPELDIG